MIRKKKKPLLSKILLCHLDFRLFLHSKQLNVWKCKMESRFLSFKKFSFFFFHFYGTLLVDRKLSISIKTPGGILPSLDSRKIQLFFFFLKLWVRSVIRDSDWLPHRPPQSPEIQAILNALCFSVFVSKVGCYSPISWVAKWEPHPSTTSLCQNLQRAKALIPFYFM